MNTTAQTTADITPRVIAVTADDQTKTYGDADPALTYQITVGTLVAGDSLTGALTREAGENVGDYAIEQGTLALSNNYDLTYVGADLTIVPAALTITAENKTKVYRQENPTLTVQYVGFVNGDTLVSLTSPPLVSTTATTSSLPGVYPITAAGATSQNYTITYVNGTLTVLSATDQINVVRGIVDRFLREGTLSQKEADDLDKKLKSAIDKIEGGQINAAISQLDNAFKNQVKQCVNKESLTAAQAQLLYDAVDLAIQALGRNGSALVTRATGGDEDRSVNAEPVSSVGELIVEFLGISFVNPTGSVTALQSARFDDSLNTLNSTFGMYGVQLVEVSSADAVIQVEILAFSPFGGLDEGILGYAEAGRVVLVSGWDWYLEADPALIGAEQYDFQTIVTHELGHSIGLTHSGDADSVMYDVLDVAESRRLITDRDLVLLRNGGEPSALRAAPRFQHDSDKAISSTVVNAILPSGWSFVTDSSNLTAMLNEQFAILQSVVEARPSRTLQTESRTAAVDEVFTGWGSDGKCDAFADRLARGRQLNATSPRRVVHSIEQVLGELFGDSSGDE